MDTNYITDGIPTRKIQAFGLGAIYDTTTMLGSYLTQSKNMLIGKKNVVMHQSKLLNQNSVVEE